MSITEELRTFAYKWGGILGHDDGRKELLAIADRIYERVRVISQNEYQRGYYNGLVYGRKQSEEDGWIRLPKDVDGITIHIGDVMDCGESTFKVNELRLTKTGWNVGDCRHHHEPTVEKLLEEMYDALDDARIPNGSEKRTYEEIIAEYAQKLQLRKETE